MIDIRPATIQDVPAIAQVHVTADWEAYAPLFGAEAYRLTIAESEERWRRALEGEGLLLVACDRGAIVGLGHACADRIDALYLLSAYHRGGSAKPCSRGCSGSCTGAAFWRRSSTWLPSTPPPLPSIGRKAHIRSASV